MKKQKVNSHLIAAAPDLYAALEQMCELLIAINPGYEGGVIYEDAAAALKKARGEQ